ncbi:MAG TPA: hypothetical protein VGD94_04000 [Vicinamibacterales bacterium]
MLKVGLLVDSLVQPRWVRRVIETIQASDCARVTLIVQNTPVPTAPTPLVSRLSRRRRHLFYSIYTRLDDYLFRRECKPDAFERVSVEDLLPDCPRIQVSPRRTRYSDFIEGQDLETIAAADLDVAIRFGFRILRGPILDTPRLGVWSYHHGDNRRYRGAPAGFWEVMKGEDTTGSILQILGPDLDNGRVIYRSFAATDKTSVRRNKNNYYWKSSDFVIRKLRQVAEHGASALTGEPAEQEFTAYSAPLYTVPRNRELLPLLIAFAWRILREKVEHLVYREQWGVAYSLGQTSHCAPPAPFRFVHVTPPRDRFWADPFPVRHGEEYYVFVEELIKGSVHNNKRKAHISAIKIDSSGPTGPPIKVLETDCHLSYPFLFEWKGTLYMVPETAGNRSVELYRCVEFPHRWVFVKPMLTNVNAVDPTLIQQGDRWWLFVNIAVDGARNVDELHVYHAADPLGDWTPHTLNPVKSDVRSSRPAGRPFIWRGELHRPAQDCSRRYGHAIVVNKITRLDPQGYEEVQVSSLKPEWRRDIVGTHTLNRSTNITVVDVLTRIPRWRR